MKRTKGIPGGPGQTPPQRKEARRPLSGTDRTGIGPTHPEMTPEKMEAETVPEGAEKDLCKVIENLRRQKEELEEQNRQLREAAEALRASEASCRIIADNAHAWEFWLDPEGRFKYASPSCKRLTGHDAHEFMTDPDLLRRIVHPEDIEGFEKHRCRVRQPQPSEELIFRVVLPDGAIRWVSHICQPLLDETGRYLGVRGSNRDVTKRQQAEDLLRLNEEQFRFLTDQSPIGIFHTDAEGRCLYTNAAWQSISGLTPAECLGDGWAAAVHPEERERVFEEGNRCMREGRDLSLVFRVQMPPGRVRWVHSRAAPIRRKDGRIVGYVGTAEDVTERREMQEKVRKAAEDWQTTFDSIQDLVMLLDHEFRIVRVNAATASFFRQPMHQLLGKHCYTLMHGTEAPVEGCPLVKMTATQRFEEAQIYDNERRRWLQVSVSPILDRQGNISRVVHTVRDITDQRRAADAVRESQRMLQLVFETIPARVFWKDRDSRYLGCNRLFLEDGGFSSHSELLGKRDADLPWAEQAGLYRADDLLVMESGEPKLGYEKPQTMADGQLIWVRAFKVPLRDEEGNVIGVLGTYENVTEHRRAEVRQAQLIAELKSVNRELDEFAYVVSHDLKAPLRAIATLADWIAADYAGRLDDHGKNMVSLIVGRVKRLHGMIDSVLQYSRTLRIREKAEEVRAGDLIAQAVDMLSLPEHVKICLQEDLPAIWCEPVRIQQVFQNLIGNAVKFMDKPQGEIRISCSQQGSCWVFGVADNGPGIDKQHHARIFQMFQTLHRRDESESSGIGLALVKKIVEMYGGAVWVESAVGQGSTFFFTLPRER